MTFTEKQSFLQEKYLPLLKTIQPTTVAQWGKMDVQQMVEHICDAFKNANGKIKIPSVPHPPEHLQKLREFILTDKPFRENTNAPFMPEIPRAHQYTSIEEAIEKLEPEINAFVEVYENNPGMEIENPVFGMLNYEMQTALLYKHVTHHLRQFGVIS
jgi:hypothetical protein